MIRNLVKIPYSICRFPIQRHSIVVELLKCQNDWQQCKSQWNAKSSQMKFHCSPSHAISLAHTLAQRATAQCIWLDNEVQIMAKQANKQTAPNWKWDTTTEMVRNEKILKNTLKILKIFNILNENTHRAVTISRKLHKMWHAWGARDLMKWKINIIMLTSHHGNTWAGRARVRRETDGQTEFLKWDGGVVSSAENEIRQKS